MLNYENFQVPDKMIDDHDMMTLREIREAAEDLDAVYVESVTGPEELKELSENWNAHVYETMRRFADAYEGEPLCLLLSGFLHLALTCVYTTSYEFEQVKMRHNLEGLGFGDDD